MQNCKHYPDESHTWKNPARLSHVALSGRCAYFREIPTWGKSSVVFLHPRLLWPLVTEDPDAQKWMNDDTDATSDTCNQHSPSHSASSPSVSEQEVPDPYWLSPWKHWVCFESTSFIWMVLKLLTRLFCPWPNLTSKTNHQISPWFPISSQKVGCYSTMGMWVQLVRRLVDMMDTVYKSKYCSMGELLVNSLLSTFFEMMETVR